jgi:hypothetical protein
VHLFVSHLNAVVVVYWRCRISPPWSCETYETMKTNPVPGAYKYEGPALQIWGVSNLRQWNSVTSPAWLQPESDCAGKPQHQFQTKDPSSRQRACNTRTITASVELEYKNSGRRSQGAHRQDELIGHKPQFRLRHFIVDNNFRGMKAISFPLPSVLMMESRSFLWSFVLYCESEFAWTQCADSASVHV